MKARWTAAVAIGIAAITVVGCTASFTPGTTDAPRTVTVAALDSFAFDPEHIQVRVGETVRFVVTNEGVLEHEFAIGSPEELQEHALTMTHGGMQTDTTTAIRIIPGQTKDLVFTFGAATDIGFGCMVPGHFPAGMSGSFDIVQ